MNKKPFVKLTVVILALLSFNVIGASALNELIPNLSFISKSSEEEIVTAAGTKLEEELQPMMASGCPTSVNQMQMQVQRGQAPSCVDRVDGAHDQFQQPHVHFNDGTAINMDGTSHHGSPTLNSATRTWLSNNGWG